MGSHYMHQRPPRWGPFEDYRSTVERRCRRWYFYQPAGRERGPDEYDEKER